MEAGQAPGAVPVGVVFFFVATIFYSHNVNSNNDFFHQTKGLTSSLLARPAANPEQPSEQQQGLPENVRGGRAGARGRARAGKEGIYITIFDNDFFTKFKVWHHLW